MLVLMSFDSLICVFSLRKVNVKKFFAFQYSILNLIIYLTRNIGKKVTLDHKSYKSLLTDESPGGFQWWVQVKKFWSRSGQFFCCLGWVSHLWFGFGKFSLKVLNFSIFSLRVKKISSGWVKTGQKVPWSKTGQPLIYCRSIVCSDRGGSGPISSFRYHFFKDNPWMFLFSPFD